MRSLFGLLAGLCLAPAVLHADEAVLPDGTRLPGRLQRADDGRLRFQPDKRSTPLSLDAIDHVRFPFTGIARPRGPLHHHLLLWDGQRITGELLSLDERAVRLRPGWSEALTLPRAAVAGIVQPAGWMTILADDFAGESGSWELTGKPGRGELERASGRRGLRLRAAGSSATWTLKQPLPAGRAGVTFREGEVPTTAHGLVELVFRTPDGPRPLRVTVPPDKTGSGFVRLPNGVRWGTRVQPRGGMAPT